MKESDAIDNNIEQSQESTEAPVVVSRDELSRVHEVASKLIEELREIPEGDLVGEIIANALKLLRDHTNRGDIKLIDKSFKELRYGLKIFAPYPRGAQGQHLRLRPHPRSTSRLQTGRRVRAKDGRRGWMVITGAGGGIMAAGHGGAGSRAFLRPRHPTALRASAPTPSSPTTPSSSTSNTSSPASSCSSDPATPSPSSPAASAPWTKASKSSPSSRPANRFRCPSSSSIPPAAPTGQRWQEYVEKQLLGRGLIGQDDLNLYKITDSVDEAVEEVRNFYKNYHSVRYVAG